MSMPFRLTGSRRLGANSLNKRCPLTFLRTPSSRANSGPGSGEPRGLADCFRLPVAYSTLIQILLRNGGNAKIRTLTQLQEVLDADMGWRIKEISTFKLAAKADRANQKVFVRAGVALVYAHWEGFVKNPRRGVSKLRGQSGPRDRDLKSCFSIFGLKGKLVLLVGCDSLSLKHSRLLTSCSKRTR